MAKVLIFQCFCYFWATSIICHIEGVTHPLGLFFILLGSCGKDEVGDEKDVCHK